MQGPRAPVPAREWRSGKEKSQRDGLSLLEGERRASEITVVTHYRQSSRGRYVAVVTAVDEEGAGASVRTHVAVESGGNVGRVCGVGTVDDELLSMFYVEQSLIAK